MGIVIRQSIYSTIISYAGAVIGYVNLLYLFPKYLLPGEVGTVRTIQDAALLFAPFAQFGLAQSIYRFHPKFSGKEDSENAFVSILLLLGLGGFTLFFVVYKIFESRIHGYFQENAQQVLEYSSLILWLTFILLITAILEAYSRSLLKAVFPNFLREVLVRLLLSVLVLLYVSGLITFHWFMIGSVLAYFCCLVILIAYLRSQGKLRLTTEFKVIDSNIFRELVRYSAFSFTSTAGMIIIGKIDSLMVAAILGLQSVAIYTTAFYMATIIEYPKRSISQVIMPLIARSFETGKIDEIQTIYRKTSINQLAIGLLMLIGIFINLDHIFQLMPRKEIYEAGKWVVVLVGAGKLIDMAFGPSSEIIVLSKYFKFNMILLVFLAIAAVTTNNLLIPLYGINGAAGGVALALFTFNATKYGFIWAKFKIQPFDKNTLIVAIVGALSIAINFFLPVLQILILDLLMRSTIVTLFYGTCLLSLRVSPDANRLFTKALSLIGIKSPFPHS